MTLLTNPVVILPPVSPVVTGIAAAVSRWGNATPLPTTLYGTPAGTAGGFHWGGLRQ